MMTTLEKRKILCLLGMVAVITGCAFRGEWSHTMQAVSIGFKGASYTARLDSDAAQTVSVYSGKREIWRGVPKSLRPWKVLLGDVDGDGRLDLGVGVYKKARFHPVMAKRPFVYTWDGKAFVPKWLGSRLSRPFTDFVLADFSGGSKLVSIEETSDGSRELAVYKWNGFGFTREWTGVRSKNLSELDVTGKPGKQLVVVHSHLSHKSYSWDGKTLKEVRS